MSQLHCLDNEEHDVFNEHGAKTALRLCTTMRAHHGGREACKGFRTLRTLRTAAGACWSPHLFRSFLPGSVLKFRSDLFDQSAAIVSCRRASHHRASPRPGGNAAVRAAAGALGLGHKLTLHCADAFDALAPPADGEPSLEPRRVLPLTRLPSSSPAADLAAASAYFSLLPRPLLFVLPRPRPSSIVHRPRPLPVLEGLLSCSCPPVSSASSLSSSSTSRLSP